jgi:hypothetical protein
MKSNSCYQAFYSALVRAIVATVMMTSLVKAAETPAAPAPGAPAAATAITATNAVAQPADNPAPPPSAPPKRSAADLEKLVAPIALYPDPLLATILPASAYPLEIVQAARFVKDTNNIAKLDTQPWDDNVKAVAAVPAVIQKMNEDLAWTISLGEAFLAQDKDVMDAVQTLRAKAQKAGTLQTSAQQTVVVTNTVVEKTVEQQVVVVTNTVVQIQPTSTEVIYVPQYNPAVVYAPPPYYVYDPWAPLITFGAGIAMGAIIANNCDWHHGGVYVGHHGAVAWGGGSYHSDVNINNNYNRNVNNNINRNTSVNNPRATPNSAGGQQKWQADKNRLQTSGAGRASAGTLESRGWNSGGARPSTQPATGAGGARPSTGAVGARPSTGAVGGAPSAGAGGARPSTGAVGARPSTGASGARPSTGAVNAQPSGGNRGAAPSTGMSSANRPSPSTASRSSGNSAFSGAGGGGNTRDYSNRGSVSRSSGSSGGRSSGYSGGGGGGRSGGFSGGGGGRGGGGGGGRR